MSMLRSWLLPVLVMAVAIALLDIALNFLNAGPALFIGAITAFAIAGGCYVGHRVVAEGEHSRPDSGEPRRTTHKVSW
jgi:hypothetical protein